MTTPVIEINGGVLEGGGQILRNAASLSCILHISINVNNIRAGRDKPGLRPQHLSGLEVIRDVCHGNLTGALVGSTLVTFQPGQLESGTYLADTKTAGSVCLLLQAALPCLFFARGPTRLVLRGGTNASFAPQIDYFTWVFKPMIERLGLRFDCNIVRRGYYPKGGGEVAVDVHPVRHVEPFTLTERGDISKITGRAFVAGTIPVKVAHGMADAARAELRKKYGNLPITVDIVKESERDAVGNGTGIIVMAESSTGCRLAGSALGSRGVPAEAVGKSAAEELIRNLEHGGCVDEYLQDQLIIFMALARGHSTMRCGPLTLHTETVVHVAKLLTTAKFTITKESESITVVECDGIGFENTS